MQIDRCLILAAGRGTRMGEIGKIFPKVIWPVFEKTLLELQVAFARRLGVENIYINLHYMSESILDFCSSQKAFSDVRIIEEKPNILDVGGAIHNLASQPEVNYTGNLLVLNADQFFYLSKDIIINGLKFLTNNACVLFTYLVDSSLGYNGLSLDSEKRVKKIIKNCEMETSQVVETYTGISLVNLSRLDRVGGPSSFFDSVASIEKCKVPTISLDNIDYWDFGTIKRYWLTMFRILNTYKNHPRHPFIRFLVEEGAIKTWKIDMNLMSYHSNCKNVINLNDQKDGPTQGSAIIFKGGQVSKDKTKCSIIWQDLCVDVM